MNNLVVLDVETGGLDNENDGLCSIALKKYDTDEKLLLYIKPNQSLKYNIEALNVNCLSLETLAENGVTEEMAVQSIISFIEANFSSKPLVLGQNVMFDIGFMKQLFKRVGSSYDNVFHYGCIDTKIVAMFLTEAGIYDFRQFNLSYLFKELTGLEPTNVHDAMYDVLMTEDVYKLMLVKTKEISDFS